MKFTENAHMQVPLAENDSVDLVWDLSKIYIFLKVHK